MMHTVKALRGDQIQADDGDIGSVEDLYFDDRRWGVCFLVVNTGPWLFGRKVMIPPASVERDQLERPRLEDSIRVHMSREDVKRSPDLGAAPGAASHLVSSAELIGYGLETPDGAFGRVEDFVVDAGQWAIADLVIDTRSWLPGGRRVLVPPTAVQSIDRPERKLRVRLSREEIRNSPPVD
jgi:sporulation protein YlmC with PRC-barrel domain